MECLQTMNNDEKESNQEELKAQEKLNLRREARRRKILENAKNRLERLNGRSSAINTSTITTATMNSEDGHYKHEHVNGPKNLDAVEFSDPEVEPNIIPQHVIQDERPMDIGNIFASFNTETTLPPQKRHIILRARLHLIISALVSCILTFVLRESATNVFSIFIPAGLCVITDLLFFREQQTLNPIINLVITIYNVRLPSQTKTIFHIFSIIQSLIVDLGVFIFNFCVFACIVVHITNNSTDSIAIK